MENLLDSRSLDRSGSAVGSTRRRFGQWDPQLIARLKLLSPWDGTLSFDGRGEEDIIRWARTGFVAPTVLSLSGTPTPKRSHKSKAGSIRCVVNACLSRFTLAAVLALSYAGEDTGDELLARFFPRRGARGE
jgi:hypothetical protein